MENSEGDNSWDRNDLLSGGFEGVQPLVIGQRYLIRGIQDREGEFVCISMSHELLREGGFYLGLKVSDESVEMIWSRDIKAVFAM